MAIAPTKDLLKHNMRTSILVCCLFALLLACDSNRLFEENKDLPKNEWLQVEKVSFEFRIRDLGKQYNLLCNVRNTSDYPYARLFIHYSLKDSTGTAVTKDLLPIFLFDAKTGKPLGNSGIGDVYDTQLPILENHTFKFTGRYTIEFEQSMRLDTLAGISAIGFRLEEVSQIQK